jgi:4'-phosphopantetheinyl transferase EntD
MSRNPARLSAELQSLFPRGVVVAESLEPGDVALLLPEEAAHLGRSVPKRAQEFAAGRLCARRALSEFSVQDFALRVAADRRPIWPDGIVGSITHTTDFCAAAVAERRNMLSIGLDCEVVGSVSAEIHSTICLELERNWISSLPAAHQAAAVTMIFSAKEAFYKCQSPVTGEWLDFHDLQIEPIAWGESRSAFRLSATRRIAIAESAVMPILGEYLIWDRYVATGISLPADFANE